MFTNPLQTSPTNQDITVIHLFWLECLALHLWTIRTTLTSAIFLLSLTTGSYEFLIIVSKCTDLSFLSGYELLGGWGGEGLCRIHPRISRRWYKIGFCKRLRNDIWCYGIMAKLLYQHRPVFSTSVPPFYLLSFFLSHCEFFLGKQNGVGKNNTF